MYVCMYVIFSEREKEEMWVNLNDERERERVLGYMTLRIIYVCVTLSDGKKVKDGQRCIKTEKERKKEREIYN